MSSRCTGLFRPRIAVPSAFVASLIAGGIGNSLHAQQAVPVPIVIPEQGGAGVAIVPAIPMQDGETRAETAQRWIRGLIQNELNLIEHICAPSPERSQPLVDLAETEWRNRLASVVRSYAETPNQRVNSDFELRVERMVLAWVGETLSEDQCTRWQKEVESRFDFRKRIVVGRMAGETERRYGLTYEQTMEVNKLLNERWKDSWWSMYRTGTLPETKFAWISAILSESQRTTGADRGSRFAEQYVGGGYVDMPSLELEKRFQIGTIASSSEIPLQKGMSNADDEQKKDRRNQIFDPRILPDID
jgi:hypothetical protein